jgi:hypothetical protein
LSASDLQRNQALGFLEQGSWILKGLMANITPEDTTLRGDQKSAVHWTVFKVVESSVFLKRAEIRICENFEREGLLSLRCFSLGTSHSSREGLDSIYADGDHFYSLLLESWKGGSQFLNLSKAEGAIHPEEKIQE